MCNVRIHKSFAGSMDFGSIGHQARQVTAHICDMKRFFEEQRADAALLVSQVAINAD